MRIIILVLVATVVPSTKGEQSESVEDAQRSNARPPAQWLSQLNTAGYELRAASQKLQQYEHKNSEMSTTLTELSTIYIRRLTGIQKTLVGQLKRSNAKSRSLEENTNLQMAARYQSNPTRIGKGKGNAAKHHKGSPSKHQKKSPPKHHKESQPKQHKDSKPKHHEESAPKDHKESKLKHNEERPPIHDNESKPKDHEERPPKEHIESKLDYDKKPPLNKESKPKHHEKSPPKHLKESEPKQHQESPPKHHEESPPDDDEESQAGRKCIDSLIDEAENLIRNFENDMEDCYSYSQKSAAASKISNAKSSLKDAQDLISKAKAAYHSCKCVLVPCHCSLNSYEVTNAVRAANDAITAVDNIKDLFDDSRIEHCMEKKMTKAASNALDIKSRYATCKDE